jgi:hypothetical protein
MRTMHIILHIGRADFLERVRRYSFLIMLGLTLFLGFQVAIGNMTVTLDEYRGEFNSAWLGSTMSFFASFFLGIFGFYLVKGSIARDDESGVGQIMAATPMTPAVYMIGKWISHVAVLISMVAILAIMGMLMQFVAGENLQLDLIAMLAPFLLITFPFLTLVSAAALLFESIRFLRGSIGNVVYFVAIVITLNVLDEQSKINPALDAFELTGTAIFRRSMMAAAETAFPEYGGGFSPGNPAPPHSKIFYWDGVNWTAEIIITRLGLILLAGMMIYITARLFKRFDGSSLKPQQIKSKKTQTSYAPGFIPQAFSTVHLTPLKPAANAFSFLNMLLFELRLLTRGQAWWWYILMGALVIVSYVPSFIPGIDFDLYVRQGILPAIFILPILIWSSMGNREVQNDVQQLAFSTPSPLWRQLPSQWLSGFLITLLVAGGPLLGFISDSNHNALYALLAAIVFVPSLALAAGVVSGTRKLFEIMYMAIWYIGPINHMPAFDYLGSYGDGNPLFFISLSILLIATTFSTRARQIRN